MTNKNEKTVCRAKLVARFCKTVWQACRTTVRAVVIGLGIVFGVSAMTVQAQSTPTFPDPTSIYTTLATPFNAALTWVIGAIAVMAVIGWIRKAIRK